MLKYDDLKTITINSLSEFIKIIEKLPQNSYYRGEDKEYLFQTSSALRTYTGEWESKEPFPFIKMIDEFYNEIAYKLNNDKIDFIAFAQHYGIPTNLLDITTSPLTALYFACQSEKDENGYVYILNEAYIDVTELIHKYPNKNLIDEVFANTPKELSLLAPLITNFKNRYPGEFIRLNTVLKKDYLYYFQDIIFENEDELIDKLKNNEYDPFKLAALLYDVDEDLKEFFLNDNDINVYNYI